MARDILAAETTEDIQLKIAMDRNQLQTAEDRSPAAAEDQALYQSDSVEPVVQVNPV